MKQRQSGESLEQQISPSAEQGVKGDLVTPNNENMTRKTEFD